MNKAFIAALAIMMTASNISATTMPLNHAEPIEAANVNTMKIEQMFPIGEAPMTYLDVFDNPEAYPECARENLDRIHAEIAAEEAAARKARSHKTSRKTTKATKATPGKMTVLATAYAPTGNKTATGTTPKAGRTIATDPRVIPHGTKVLINGVEYTAEDTGGLIKGNRIDIFMDTEAECVQFGAQYIEVEVLK